MSSVGARAYGSILNHCTPTVYIVRRFNFSSFFLISMGMHLALSVMKDTLSQIWVLYIYWRNTVVKSEWSELMKSKHVLQYGPDLDCLLVAWLPVCTLSFISTRRTDCNSCYVLLHKCVAFTDCHEQNMHASFYGGLNVVLMNTQQQSFVARVSNLFINLKTGTSKWVPYDFISGYVPPLANSIDICIHRT